MVVKSIATGSVIFNEDIYGSKISIQSYRRFELFVYSGSVLAWVDDLSMKYTSN